MMLCFDFVFGSQEGKVQILFIFLLESPRQLATTTVLETTANNVQKYVTGEKTLLGEFENPLHGVAGMVYIVASDKLLIQDFAYDGRGPDAFFWVGTEGSVL